MEHNIKKTLLADSIRLSFGTFNVLNGAWLRSETGKVTGVLGRNGSGKSCMFRAIMGTLPDFDFSCHVSFDDKIMYFSAENAYRVRFKYFCADAMGNIQENDAKYYTVQIKLHEIGDTEINWADRIDNPLGLRVSEYKVIEGDGDPLNTGFRGNN